MSFLKFIYSEKASKFREISTVDLSYVVPVKYTVEISQNFVAFSKYLNFTKVLKYFKEMSKNRYHEMKWVICEQKIFGHYSIQYSNNSKKWEKYAKRLEIVYYHQRNDGL